MGEKGRERVKEGPNSFSSHRHYLIPWALPLHPFLACFMHRSIMRICHPLIGKLRKKWASKAIRSSLSLGLSVLSLSFLASPLFGIPYKWENLHCKYILKLCLIKPKPFTSFLLFWSKISRHWKNLIQSHLSSSQHAEVWILHMVAFLPIFFFFFDLSHFVTSWDVMVHLLMKLFILKLISTLK